MNKINAICRCGKQNEIFIRAFEDSISKYSEYKCLSCIIKARGSKNGDGMRNKVKAAIGYLNSDIILLRCVRCNNIIRIKYGSYKGWKNKHLDLQEYMCGSCFNRAQDRSSSRTIEHKKKCSERAIRCGSIPPSRKGVCGDKHPYWKGGKPKCRRCGKQISYYKK
jgi:hypothetical protein